METTENIKDAVRKVKNTIVDKTQELTGITKSPKDLAERMIEHLTKGEHHEVATMLSIEVGKYVDKMGLASTDIAQKKLEDFKKSIDDLATDLDKNDYKKISKELEKLSDSIPDDIAKHYDIFDKAKKMLKDIVKVFAKSAKDEAKVDFEKLKTLLEDSFSKIVNK